MIKSYFIDHPISIAENQSPIDAIADRFSLPELCIASYIVIPPHHENSLNGIWVTLFQDPCRTQFELGALGILFLDLISTRFDGALERQGLNLVSEDGGIGGIDLGEGSDRLWVCQLAVSKTKNGYSVRIPQKPAALVSELSVDIMQSYISDFEMIKGACS